MWTYLTNPEREMHPQRDFCSAQSLEENFDDHVKNTLGIFQIRYLKTPWTKLLKIRQNVRKLGVEQNKYRSQFEHIIPENTPSTFRVREAEIVAYYTPSPDRKTDRSKTGNASTVCFV